MQKMRYFVFCIAFNLLHQLQNCAQFQTTLVILRLMVYKNIEFSCVLPNSHVPLFWLIWRTPPSGSVCDPYMRDFANFYDAIG